MNERRIGIVGQGFVGNSLKEGMIGDHPNLLTYDTVKEKSMCHELKDLVDECNVIFICVPTPMDSEGACFTGIVEGVLDKINALVGGTSPFDEQPIMVLKTTVPPGTTRDLNDRYQNIEVTFNPEFLTEANAVEDFKNQNRIILGGERKETLDIIATLYRKSFPLVPIVYMSPDEAEMVKYVTNTFLANKVIFANEMYRICKGLKLDYDRVIDAAKLDTRLGQSHWKVPGPDGDFGFGGHCFPKDTNAIRYIANTNYIGTPVLDMVLDTNNKLRKNRDWEKQEGRAVIHTKQKENVTETTTAE